MLNKKFRFTFETILFIALAYASYLLLLLSLPYLAFERDIEFLETKQLIYHLDWWRISFYVHVFTSPLVIFTGLVQFNNWSINKYPRLHKICGYIYIPTVIFLAAPSALLIGLYANGSYPTQISFSILSLLWMLTTVLAFKCVRAKNFHEHSRWVFRSFMLTLSAVTLRFYAFLFDQLNVAIDPVTTYIILAFLSWIPNVIVGEILLRLNYPTRFINSPTLK